MPLNWLSNARPRYESWPASHSHISKKDLLAVPSPSTASILAVFVQAEIPQLSADTTLVPLGNSRIARQDLKVDGWLLVTSNTASSSTASPWSNSMGALVV